MIDRTKFLEPTEKYLQEFADKTPAVAKDWYNADLIGFALQWKNADYDNAVNVQLGYQQFCQYYDIVYTMKELDKHFGDYPVDSFNELLKELVQNAKNESKNSRSN